MDYEVKKQRVVEVEGEVTLKMSVDEFRLLDATQYHMLGGGTDESYAINDAFRGIRDLLGIGKPKHNVTTDQGLGRYVDAEKVLGIEV